MFRKCILPVLLLLSVLVTACASTEHAAPSDDNTSTADVQQNPSIIDAANVTPDEIIGMKKFVVMKGEEALEFIKKTHVGEIKYVEDIAVLHYAGNDSFVVLWVTVYPSPEVAKNETEKMVESMKKFGGIWAAVRPVKLGDVEAYRVPEKEHYFFAEGRYMVYIMPHGLSGDEIVRFVEEIYKCLKS
ncbi:hypothetical protein [Archaeoglobus veneficus]|uniref:Lipoprotein n=1 Tax=Archaeoglobus veneficus (strain DSM 11195 / SNP6) TaxID=693661 RepID=F2KQF2_ARCVS|nr:hypothetical protein [Archaeoglobus veneficus]AEA47685.1 hypothetical protein Arcve_1686 [Archaeoglobus veneficus SNP6]